MPGGAEDAGSGERVHQEMEDRTPLEAPRYPVLCRHPDDGYVRRQFRDPHAPPLRCLRRRHLTESAPPEPDADLQRAGHRDILHPRRRRVPFDRSPEQTRTRHRHHGVEARGASAADTTRSVVARHVEPDGFDTTTRACVGARILGARDERGGPQIARQPSGTLPPAQIERGPKAIQDRLRCYPAVAGLQRQVLGGSRRRRCPVQPQPRLRGGWESRLPPDGAGSQGRFRLDVCGQGPRHGIYDETQRIRERDSRGRGGCRPPAEGESVRGDLPAERAQGR
mmetsp:Transcript_52886/g.125856  ORF Transcript_52886/g.125856 Transcript_52886/m.125856 type:complete len:281 (+) Transcript_52886:1719-2561(+)